MCTFITKIKIYATLQGACPCLPSPLPPGAFSLRLSPKLQGPSFCLCNLLPKPIQSTACFHLCYFLNKLSLIVRKIKKKRTQQEKGKGDEKDPTTEASAQERGKKSERTMLKEEPGMTTTQKAQKAAVPLGIGALGGMSPRKVTYLNINGNSCLWGWGDELMIRNQSKKQ